MEDDEQRTEQGPPLADTDCGRAWARPLYNVPWSRRMGALTMISADLLRVSQPYAVSFSLNCLPLRGVSSTQSTLGTGPTTSLRL
jgi:hypothetical protein